MAELGRWMSILLLPMGPLLRNLSLALRRRPAAPVQTVPADRLPIARPLLLTCFWDEMLWLFHVLLAYGTSKKV